jgi:hypothetical protein
MVHGDARSSARDEEESAEDRRQRTRQIGDRLVSQWSRSQSQSPRDVDPRKGQIARLKSKHRENKAERIAVLMDAEIERMPKDDQPKFAPLDKWKKFAPHLRTWKEFIDHRPTRKRVRTYINKVKPLSSEISRKAS